MQVLDAAEQSAVRQERFTSGMRDLFKAVVMAVLLYGSKSWSLTPAALKRLKDFVIRATYQMAQANKPQRNLNGTWEYPEISDVHMEVGLYLVKHYFWKRRNTIAQFLADHPLHDLVNDARRQRGS